MYSNTKKWRADRAKARERNNRLLRARSHVCPDSSFFTEHFNFQQQSTVMNKERDLWEEQKRREPGVLGPLYPAFGGKKFKPSSFAVFDEDYGYSSVPAFREPGAMSSGRLYKGKHLQTTVSAVLSEPTIWQSDWVDNKNVVCLDDFSQNTRALAPFPTVAELKCEGPDRIATLLEHRRFLPYPRENRNETVSWSQRPYLKPHRLDGLQEAHVLTQEDILTHDLELGLPNISDLAPHDNSDADDDAIEDEYADPYMGDTARRFIGDDLFDALDQKHVYF